MTIPRFVRLYPPATPPDGLAYWLLFGGLMLMVLDLTLAGLVEAQLWQMGAPWTSSLDAARPYWIVRTLSAIPIASGFIAFLVGLTTGPRSPMRGEVAS